MLLNQVKHSQQSDSCTLMDAGHLQQLYSRAMQMEADFFNAQPDTPGLFQLRVLVVDFDETCTASDSTSEILGTAVAAVTGPAGKLLPFLMSPMLKDGNTTPLLQAQMGKRHDSSGQT